MTNDPRARPCSSPRLNSINSGSAWSRAWWQATPDFSPLPTKRPRRSWEWHGSPFPIWAPKVRSVASAKRSAGSEKRSDGASAAKGASARSTDATEPAAASIKGMQLIADLLAYSRMNNKEIELRQADSEALMVAAMRNLRVMIEESGASEIGRA